MSPARLYRRTLPQTRLGLTKPDGPQGHGSDAAPGATPALRGSADREVRIGVLLPLADVLAAHSLPLAEVLAEAGAPEDLFADPENRTTDIVVCRLLAIAAARMGLPHLGLLIAKRGAPPNLGAVGEMARHCATLGGALRALITHLHLNNRAAVPVMLGCGPGRVILGYAIYHRLDVPVRAALDLSVASACSLLAQLCGPRCRPVEVRFAYDEPGDLLPYREAFGCPVHFNAELSGVVFPADLLDLRLPDADPERCATLEAQIREARRRAGMSFAQQVNAVLPQAILSGRCTQTDVAQIFAMHERTLRRRLLAEGASFHALLADARRELATQLLANTRLGVAAVSRALGYADPNVFSRAFRAWTGASPTAWREGLADPAATTAEPIRP